jgi:hypothetical protein
MGQNRNDTNQQLAAKQRVAERRRCFQCARKSAMSSPYELRDDYGRRIGTERTCNYCGARRGIVNGQPYREPS